MKLRKLIILVVAGAFLGLSPSAQADSITIVPCVPTTFSGCVDPVVYGNDVAEPAVQTAVQSYFDANGIVATQLYKSDFVEGSEGGLNSGDLAASYATEFGDFRDTVSLKDPTGAEIRYTGGDVVGPPAFLLVKDGNAEPAWYLFDLTALGWDGTQTLILSNFWPSQGAISHVALYGNRETRVPEPSTLLLLGAGLIGLGILRRRQ